MSDRHLRKPQEGTAPLPLKDELRRLALEYGAYPGIFAVLVEAIEDMERRKEEAA